MSNGPQPLDGTVRRAHMYEIAAQIRAHYQEHLLALGVYGSLARGSDGPFSDIEMHCVLQGEGTRLPAYSRSH